MRPFAIVTYNGGGGIADIRKASDEEVCAILTRNVTGMQVFGGIWSESTIEDYEDSAEEELPPDEIMDSVEMIVSVSVKGAPWCYDIFYN